MKRSAGVTAAAVVMLVWSGVILFLWLVEAVQILAGRYFSRSNPLPELPSIIAGSSFYPVGCALGIATGAGLLRLRGWARIVTLVFSGVAIGMSVMLAAVLLLGPSPWRSSVSPASVRKFNIFFLSIFAAAFGIALWWLVYFKGAKVSAQFSGPAQEAENSPWKQCKETRPFNT